MTTLIFIACLASVLVIFSRLSTMISILSQSDFAGGAFCFALYTLGWGLLFTGAVAIMFGNNDIGGPAMLVGVAIRLLTDRRRYGC